MKKKKKSVSTALGRDRKSQLTLFLFGPTGGFRHLEHRVYGFFEIDILYVSPDGIGHSSE